jgi:hypothetical protein
MMERKMLLGIKKRAEWASHRKPDMVEKALETTKLNRETALAPR